MQDISDVFSHQNPALQLLEEADFDEHLTSFIAMGDVKLGM